MRGDGLFLTMIFVGIPWVLGWIGKTHWAHQRQMRALELRAEAQNRLVDRFGTDPNFLEFMKASGSVTLPDVPVVDNGRSQTYMRMLTAVQLGFILIGAGTAFLATRTYLVSHDIGMRDDSVFVLFGALGVALGIGSILSAVAAFVVGRQWKSLHSDGPAPAHREHA